MRSIVIEETEPGKRIVIDAIKSRISPYPERIHDLLDLFEKGDHFGNYDLSDGADEIMNDLDQFYVKLLDLREGVQILLNYYWNHSPDYINDFDLSVYRETLEWMVLVKCAVSSIDPILRSEVPYIREFLNTPPGQEVEAVQKWMAYWDSVDFDARRNDPTVPM